MGARGHACGWYKELRVIVEPSQSVIARRMVTLPSTGLSAGHAERARKSFR
jgi:hypothetical protein